MSWVVSFIHRQMTHILIKITFISVYREKIEFMRNYQLSEVKKGARLNFEVNLKPEWSLKNL